MDESGSRDLELLLLAVQHGVLSNAQVEDCLRSWEEKHGASSGIPPAPLQDVAVQKGYVIPLFQSIKSVAYGSSLGFTKYDNGWILPQSYSLKS